MPLTLVSEMGAYYPFHLWASYRSLDCSQTSISLALQESSHLTGRNPLLIQSPKGSFPGRTLLGSGGSEIRNEEPHHLLSCSQAPNFDNAHVPDFSTQNNLSRIMEFILGTLNFSSLIHPS